MCVCAQIKVAAAKSNGGEIPGKKKLRKPWYSTYSAVGRQ